MSAATNDTNASVTGGNCRCGASVPNEKFGTNESQVPPQQYVRRRGNLCDIPKPRVTAIQFRYELCLDMLVATANQAGHAFRIEFGQPSVLLGR